MLARLTGWLGEPSLRALDVDGLDFSLAHREVLLRKKMVRELFRSFYDDCRAMDLLHFGDCPGSRLEIGFSRDLAPAGEDLSREEEAKAIADGWGNPKR